LVSDSLTKGHVMPRKKSPPKLTVALPNRLPLAGQCNDHEARLREKLIEQFKPADAFEEMWIEDIAYCSVAIEHDRAMIAAFVHACVRRAHVGMTNMIPIFEPNDCLATPRDLAQEARLELYEWQNFTPVNGVSYLGERHFASLLGHLGQREHYQLRHLQMMLQHELAERDRLINQLKRSRRQAMIDAIEFAELAARAAEAGRAMPQAEEAEPQLLAERALGPDSELDDAGMSDSHEDNDGCHADVSA